MMHIVVLLVALAMLLTGVVLWVLAYRLRIEAHPRHPFNPKNWIPVWHMKSWFTPRGYRLNLIGTFLVCGGALLYLVYGWLR